MSVLGTCDVCTDKNLMRHVGEEFYKRLTLELPPPDLDSSATTLAAVRARFTPLADKTAEVDSTVYAAWADACDVAKFWKAQVREYEILLRDQAQDATVLTVDGEVVAKRLVFDADVKAHPRHMDYYRRVQQKEDNDE